MTRVPHLIVGGGMTAHAAARGIREVDRNAPIALLSIEPHRPYARPPLSKKLWAGGEEASIWLEDVPGLDLRLGVRAVSIDRAAREVVDERGDRHGYEKLLLATGCTPRRLPWKDERIVHFRTLDDFRKVREAVAAGRRRVAVIGGGFIGTEMAASLATNGAEVTMIFPDPTLGARIFPPELGAFVAGYYREKGVALWAGELLASATARPDGLSLATGTGRELTVDLVVAGIGVTPDVALARDAGLAVGDGIEVDASLRTADPAIWAAGDVASFPSPALGKRMRVEHEDNALTQGRVAGRAMAGEDVRYDHLPFFYSDLFDLGYEAVGEVDARHEVVSAWKRPLREGVMYYLAGQRVRGVLLWNVFGQVDAARALIAAPGPFRPEDGIATVSG
jgi:3-phenylpropionate/trans-cinnamate dioxygenase ferredoxin reductase component